MDKCDLCAFVGSDGGGATVVCGSAALTTIRRHSATRKDDAHLIFEGRTSAELHVECRKIYTRRSKSPTQPAAMPKQKRTSTLAFDFKIQCLFCEKAVDVTHPERHPFCTVSTLEIIETIRSGAHGRNDEWGNSVAVKLSTVSDLVAAEGRYHKECFNYFMRKGSHLPRTFSAHSGTEDKRKTQGFDLLCQELEQESNDDCQYTLEQLINMLKGYDPSQDTYSDKHLKRKLQEKYGDAVTFTELPGRRCVVCFTGVAHKILCDKWYRDRCDDPEKEALRIIKTAAQLVRQAIKSRAYESSFYPSSAEMATGGEGLIPKYLEYLVDEILLSGRKKNTQLERKASSIKHSIVATARPRSFLSPLQVGLSVSLHRRYGSKNLVELLHNLGMCASYKEAVKYEGALVKCAPATVDASAYIQVVFDNADHNVRTLNGFGTFHTMGGILCVTPKSALHADAIVPRSMSSIENIDGLMDRTGFLPIQHYFYPECNGYSKLTAKDMTEVQLDASSVARARSLDFLWSSGLWSGASPHPGWNGYMEVAHQNSLFEVTSVTPLPFINLDPTNLSTIYTALMYAVGLCEKQNQSYCMVTFDQPLFAKAAQMVLAASPESPLKKIIVRLGGFHLLKSFVGSIGAVMAGSGLEECFATVYAKKSVVHMMSGDAYARAIRGHFLVQLSLVTLLFEALPDGELRANLKTLSDDLLVGNISINAVQQSSDVQKGLLAIQSLLTEASSKSRTCKLWAQYFETVNIIRLFIRAERTGDWALHLLAIQRMLPYFHAAGHLNYAKSAQVYLQQMMEIEAKLPTYEFERFVEAGYFTIRRTEKFWSGIWTDMTIEQVLMKAIKAVGGLTHGRGLSESTISKWVHGAPACAVVIDSVECFAGVSVHSSDQHVELRESRQKQDHSDADKILDWLRLHHPFDRKSPLLVSLATGRVAHDSVNCDNAVAVGEAAMKKMDGIPFSEVHLRRKDSVISLATAAKGMVVRNKLVDVNPEQLFHRMLLTKSNDDELAQHLTFELKEPPPALFDDSSAMRQSAKSSLMSLLPEEDPEIVICPSIYVVDGGFLMRQVQWLRNETYGEICNKYLAYLKHKCRGQRVLVVFDGYDGSSTKDPAHARRASKGSTVHVIVEDNVQAIVEQEVFLTNGRNKMSLIRLLSSKLRGEGIEVIQATADADRLIVTTAVERSRNDQEVCIIGKDTDLAVLLTALTPPHKDVKILMPGVKGNPPKVYSSKSCQEALGEMQDCLLFLHAATGCDTTSAIFYVGKIKSFKKLKKDTSLQKKVAAVFNDPQATADDVANAGEEFISSQYAGKVEDRLDKRRFELYQKINRKLPTNRKFDLSQLPPTSSAARQHSLRVYHQVQSWRGNDLPPTQWGWQEEHGHLFPVTNTPPPAPSELLTLVSCNCVSGCETSNCTCRKNHMDCANFCGYCAGLGCSNRTAQKNNSDDNIDEELEELISNEDLEDAQQIADDTMEPPVTRRRRRV